MRAPALCKSARRSYVASVFFQRTVGQIIDLEKAGILKIHFGNRH